MAGNVGKIEFRLEARKEHGPSGIEAPKIQVLLGDNGLLLYLPGLFGPFVFLCASHPLTQPLNHAIGFISYCLTVFPAPFRKNPESDSGLNVLRSHLSVLILRVTGSVQTPRQKF